MVYNMSIRIKYEQELSTVQNKLVLMCRLTELAIEKSVTALVRRDKELSSEVIADDKNVDNLEREIEQDCLKILLMEHPVAKDFREVSAALKMITDLERIADQASDISEIALQFKDEKYIKKLEHIPLMAELAIGMVKDSVESYLNRDLALARGLDARDDKVDELFETIKKDLVELIKADGNNADQAILLMMIAKYLERIGDHAVNIGEWVEYAIIGQHNG
jgi:phosphate transport system protein